MQFEEKPKTRTSEPLAVQNIALKLNCDERPCQPVEHILSNNESKDNKRNITFNVTTPGLISFMINVHEELKEKNSEILKYTR